MDKLFELGDVIVDEAHNKYIVTRFDGYWVDSIAVSGKWVTRFQPYTGSHIGYTKIGHVELQSLIDEVETITEGV